MATARKLPSGTYRCVVYIGTDENGKRKYQSITDPDKKRCERLAAEFADLYRHQKYDGTFESALTRYLTLKNAVLSASTVRGYKVIERYLTSHHRSFCALRLRQIDKDVIQQLVNEMTVKYKPKTVRNNFGLISSVMRYHDYPVPKVTLPEKNKPELKIPDTKDVQKIIEASRGTDLEIPILLAAFGPMRRSEIVALKLEDISDKNVIHVSRAVVVTDDYKVVEKSTKTYDSDRYIPMSAEIISKIRKRGYVTKIENPNILTGRFEKLVREIGCKGVRFHDLRHWCASYLHAQGVPDVYIKARAGWKTDTVMKSVYTHALISESDRWNKDIDNMVSNIMNGKNPEKNMQHEMQHEVEKMQ